MNKIVKGKFAFSISTDESNRKKKTIVVCGTIEPKKHSNANIIVNLANINKSATRVFRYSMNHLQASATDFVSGNHSVRCL